MEGFSIITYKSKEIYYADYSVTNGSKEQLLKLINDLSDMFINQPRKSVLILTNIANIHFDINVLKAMRDLNSKISPFIKKIAIFGIESLFLSGYNFVTGIQPSELCSKAFCSELEAKEWLAAN